MTAHQRRVRELEALRRLIADLEAQIATAPAIAPAAVADAFEQHTSLLPNGSRLLQEWRAVAAKLRQSQAPAIDRPKVRSLVAKFQRQADDLAVWLEARERKLRGRGRVT